MENDERFWKGCRNAMDWGVLTLAARGSRSPTLLPLCCSSSGRSPQTLCRFAPAWPSSLPSIRMIPVKPGIPHFPCNRGQTEEERRFRMLALTLNENRSVKPHPLLLPVGALALFRGRGTGRSGFPSVLLKSTSPAVSRLAGSTPAIS